ncbi:protein AF-9-like isoform X2 [Drosophila takahashii]|uniref:protein AF-9-like isoform X2 n=1 Tax=Drosophila takahashii TaxID=29030 RepID=UPI0038991A8D
MHLQVNAIAFLAFLVAIEISETAGMSVKVQFEIGHTSTLRSKVHMRRHDFTHDFEIYVQGVNKADISAFVEKVVFELHPSFPNPRRVVKEPPYAIQESGYAGFPLAVEIYFRNRDEPKRIVYPYDLVIVTTASHQQSEIKTHIFEDPSEDFRAMMIQGGGFATSIGACNLDATNYEEQISVLTEQVLNLSDCK